VKKQRSAIPCETQESMVLHFQRQNLRRARATGEINGEKKSAPRRSPQSLRRGPIFFI
jgi:hypothetical protein